MSRRAVCCTAVAVDAYLRLRAAVVFDSAAAAAEDGAASASEDAAPLALSLPL